MIPVASLTLADFLCSFGKQIGTRTSRARACMRREYFQLSAFAKVSELARCRDSAGLQQPATSQGAERLSQTFFLSTIYALLLFIAPGLCKMCT